MGDVVIGRADLLKSSEAQNNRVEKTKGVNVDRFFSGIPNSEKDRSFLNATIEGGVQVPKEEVVHINGFSSDLDRELCSKPDVEKIIKDNTGEAVVTLPIKNTDRSTGAMLAGNIARAHGNRDFKGQINVQFEGSAGQSFGAFTLPGLSLRLVGEGNDYVGKGMHGGDIVVMLGSVGRNVGAGMTGGIGYFYDADNSFDDKVNLEIVKVQRLSTTEGEAQLKHMI